LSQIALVKYSIDFPKIEFFQVNVVENNHHGGKTCSLGKNLDPDSGGPNPLFKKSGIRYDEGSGAGDCEFS
jgi:hypothetical protein